MSIALSSETLGWQPRVGLGETIEELLLMLSEQRGELRKIATGD
jgi:hypothetical protein